MTTDTAPARLDEATRARLDAVVEGFVARWNDINAEEAKRTENRGNRKQFLAAVKAEQDRTTPALQAILAEAYPDVADRTAAAAAYIKPISVGLVNARQNRDLAALQIVREGGKPVDAYTAIGVTRSMFARSREQYEKKINRGTVAEPAYRDPFTTGKESAAETIRLIPYMDAVRPLRDLSICEAVADDPSWVSAELARMFDVVPQRVTSLRTGR